MPSVVTADPSRIVLDESSFDFRNLSDIQIERHLDDLNETLLELRGRVAHAPMWDGFDCLDNCELYRFLTGEHESDVSRDTRVLSHQLLDRCSEWDSGLPDLDLTVAIGSGEPKTALSAGYALAQLLSGYGVACLVFPGESHRGFALVTGSRGSGEIFFFGSSPELPAFWRWLYSFERVPEHGFFELAKAAFPQLVFHPDLAFRHFEGSYIDVRDRVVHILAGLNDHFSREYKDRDGIPDAVQAAMGQYGVDLSPESPRTRGSSALMRERVVTYNGEQFDCEWHAKLERHRNRIHFSTPGDRLEGRILICKFTLHLT